jgi:hypothetical protein
LRAAGNSAPWTDAAIADAIEQTWVEFGFLSLQPYRELFPTASNLQDAMNQVKAQTQRSRASNVDLKGR